jgi:hypothetical protein
MKAVDTNVLARFFINDADDREAVRQRPAAVAALSGAVYVPVSVTLEFEWLMRGFYELSRKDIQRPGDRTDRIGRISTRIGFRRCAASRPLRFLQRFPQF